MPWHRYRTGTFKQCKPHCWFIFCLELLYWLKYLAETDIAKRSSRCVWQFSRSQKFDTFHRYCHSFLRHERAYKCLSIDLSAWKHDALHCFSVQQDKVDNGPQDTLFNENLMIVTKSTKNSLIRTYPLISRGENLKMLPKYCSYHLLLSCTI